MAKKIKNIIEFIMYEGTLTNNPADTDRVKNTTEETSISELFRRRESIADATSDQAIPLPDSATDYLLIFTDQQISIKLNGSSDAIILTPKSSGTKTFVHFIRGTISALTISNDSGSAANVDIISVQI